MKRRILLFSVLSDWRCLRHLRAVVLLTILMSSTLVVQAQVTVKGKITDETGSALPGVNILQKGTTTGTTSDGDGNYALEVQGSDAILVFSFIGYATKEVVVGSQSTINTNLEPDIQALAEVVVVGYGTQKREAVTGSVVSVSGDVMREVPSSNFSQALQGRAVGVEISQTDTKPGAGMQILIRGQRSLTADNAPLIVLDGIPFNGTMNDINSNNIKSIDILKDASATAIYGSRGANGVILISTIKGQKGQKAKITYNGYYGVKKVFAPYPMMNGPEFIALRKQTPFKYTVDEDSTGATSTDWQSKIYKTGVVTSHDIGITGGTERGGYSFGLGYYKDGAVIPIQDFTRYSLRASIDQEVTNHIKLGFSTNSNFSVNNGNGIPAVGSALNLSPIINPYNDDGTLKTIVIQQTSGAQWTPTRGRYEGLGDAYIDQTKAYGSYNTFYTEVKIPGIEGLKYRANLGLNYRQSTGGTYTGQGVFSGTPTVVSNASITNNFTTNWAIENLVTYDRTFKDKHELNVVAMYSSQKNFNNSSTVSAKDIPSDAFQFYNLGRANGVISVNGDYQGYQVWGLSSYMGRVMYAYDDRYMLTATFRTDGSSRLAPGHKWHAYPAVSAGWNISKEQFMSGISQINHLKLRVGYGQTSNQGINPYQTLGTLSTRPYNFGDATYSTGFYVSQLPNPGLGWEYSKTTNFGLDFKIFNNRLSGTVEYYIQNTKDILLDVGLPPTSGVNKVTKNVGSTQNKGIEITLNGTIIDNPTSGFTWDIGFNVYANRNKITSLASGATRDETNWWFVGHPMNVIFDYQKVGLWQTDDQYLNIYEPGLGAAPGMIKVKYTGDFNPDGSPTRAIGAADRQIMSMQPNWQGGFNTHLSYKGLDLTIVGAFRNGGLINSTLYGGSSYLNNLNARAGNNVKVDYWTPEHTNAKFPKPYGIGGDNPKYANSLGYFDGSYMKIRTITLGYNISDKLLKKTGISNMRIYVTAQNPFVAFSPYKKQSGMDPETNSQGNQNAAVPLSDNLKRILTIGTNTPSTRNYLVGLNFTF